MHTQPKTNGLATHLRHTALAGSFLAAMAATPALAQSEATFRIASILPEQSTMSVAMVEWGDAVTERTDGRIQFRYFWSASLLGSAESAAGIRDGRADGGLTGGVFLPARLPLATVGTLPFMTSNVPAMGYAHEEMYTSYEPFRAEFDRAGLQVVGWMPGGVNTVFAKEPINNIDDMENLQIRTVGLGADAMNAIGANPIAIPANEIYEALGKGLLEASSGLPVDLGIDFSLHEQAPYIIDTNYGVYTVALYAISKDKYDGLDDETRAIIDEESGKFMESYYLPNMKEAEAARCERAKEDGATFIVWDDAEVDRWVEALGSTARDRWSEQVEGYGADGATFLTSFEEALRAQEEANPWTNAIAGCAE